MANPLPDVTVANCGPRHGHVDPFSKQHQNYINGYNYQMKTEFRQHVDSNDVIKGPRVHQKDTFQYYSSEQYIDPTQRHTGPYTPHNPHMVPLQCRTDPYVTQMDSPKQQPDLFNPALDSPQRRTDPYNPHIMNSPQHRMGPSNPQMNSPQHRMGPSNPQMNLPQHPLSPHMNSSKLRTDPHNPHTNSPQRRTDPYNNPHIDSHKRNLDPYKPHMDPPVPLPCTSSQSQDYQEYVNLQGHPHPPTDSFNQPCRVPSTTALIGNSPACNRKFPALNGNAPILNGNAPKLNGNASILNGNAPKLNGNASILNVNAPNLNGKASTSHVISAPPHGATPSSQKPANGAQHVDQIDMYKNGAKCLKCTINCPGLELHYFRKICKICRCLAEDHDVSSGRHRHDRPVDLLFESRGSLEMEPGSKTDPKSQSNLDSKLDSKTVQKSEPKLDPKLDPKIVPKPDSQPDLMPDLKLECTKPFQKLSMSDPGDLTQLKPAENDVVLTKLITENVRSQKFISLLPEDKQEFASQLRRKQLQRQLPLHDLDPRFCSSLATGELAKFHKFSERRRKKAAGVGQIGEVTSSGSIVPCHNCQQTMESGGPAVIAGKVPGQCWHPGCFACATCRQLLVDMIYFVKKGVVYCERHYADLLYPRCAACDEMIFSREYTQAEGKSWHVHHFCCWYCDGALAGQRYIAKDNNPYCVTCFDKLFSKMCNTCQKPITADAPGITHGELHWHACPHCFSCHGCGRNMLAQQILLKDRQIYCGVQCWDSCSPRYQSVGVVGHFKQ